MSKWQAAGHTVKILNGQQFVFFLKYRKLLTKINIECCYIEKEPSSDSEAGVRSENWFVVYARYTTLVKLTSPSIMINLTIKYKIENQWTFKMLLQLFFVDERWIIKQYTLLSMHLVFWVTWPAVNFTTAIHNGYWIVWRFFIETQTSIFRERKTNCRPNSVLICLTDSQSSIRKFI